MNGLRPRRSPRQRPETSQPSDEGYTVQEFLLGVTALVVVVAGTLYGFPHVEAGGSDLPWTLTVLAPVLPAFDIVLRRTGAFEASELNARAVLIVSALLVGGAALGWACRASGVSPRGMALTVLVSGTAGMMLVKEALMVRDCLTRPHRSRDRD